MDESVTITDNRTGESIEVPIVDGGVDSRAWRKLLGGIWFHDPGLATTAVTSSAVAEIGRGGRHPALPGLPHRAVGRAQHLPGGRLPPHPRRAAPAGQLDDWVDLITHHTFIHENFRKRIYDAFHYDAHPMGLLTSGVAGLSTFYPESKDIGDPPTARIRSSG